MTKAMWAAAIAAAVSLVAGAHEWSYHQSHRFRPGPSGEIAAIGLSVAVLGAVVAYIAWVIYDRDQR